MHQSKKTAVQLIKLGRRLQVALLNAHAANELNGGKEPLSARLHTAIYCLEMCVEEAGQNLKTTPKRI